MGYVARQIRGWWWHTFQVAQNIVGTGIFSPKWSTTSTASSQMRPRNLGPSFKWVKKSLREIGPACNPCPSSSHKTLYPTKVSVSNNLHSISKLMDLMPSNTGQENFDEQTVLWADTSFTPAPPNMTPQVTNEGWKETLVRIVDTVISLLKYHAALLHLWVDTFNKVST